MERLKCSEIEKTLDDKRGPKQALLYYAYFDLQFIAWSAISRTVLDLWCFSSPRTVWRLSGVWKTSLVNNSRTEMWVKISIWGCSFSCNLFSCWTAKQPRSDFGWPLKSFEAGLMARPLLKWDSGFNEHLWFVLSVKSACWFAFVITWKFHVVPVIATAFDQVEQTWARGVLS